MPSSPQLHRVADNLARQAKGAGVLAEDADALGRSAFNRYYYATYLTVRDLLGLIDAAWKKESHAKIPELLEGAVLKKLRAEARKQERSGVISKSHEKGLIYQATTASSEIASTLKIAYQIRVISDYQPEERITFVGDQFWLQEHSDREASNWISRVEMQKGNLVRISKELGIV